MSVLDATMYNNNQLNMSGHMRSRSYNEVLNQFKNSITSESRPGSAKKRSYSDLLNSSQFQEVINPKGSKRSRTAPPYPPPSPDLNESRSRILKFKAVNTRARSLSPNRKKCVSSSNSPSTPAMSPEISESGNVITKKDVGDSSPTSNAANITLPSFSSVLNDTNLSQSKLKTITPTTSLDYFDTYKPNDENWRYGLLGSMNNDTKKYLSTSKTLSSGDHDFKPEFDSRINNRPILPPISKLRKVNYPYESNYTYLNKTYLNDVEKYPEYLELAQSLVSLSGRDQGRRMSQPHSSQSHSQQSQQQSQQPQQQSQQPQQQSQQPQQQSQQPQPQPQSHPAHPAQPQPQPQPHSYYYQPQVVPSVPLYPHQAYQSYQSPYGPYQNSYQSAYYSGYNSYGSGMNYPEPVTPPKKNNTKFIPITPPSAKQKTARDIKSPPKSLNPPRVCISCGSDQSPCWRPSWSSKEGQLCNSCGLRYKKTSARCLNDECKKIPAKGEWSLMVTKGTTKFEDGSEGYGCLECGSAVEVKR